ncbi:uncharacterized protein LOC62_05G007559 [Vanrija pseudolonga]|uniref:Uncharacterized protein n=1 Tax=Vanrija pseudolonga TaxID=143232 RepID=A0AAF0YCQ4_9TREE|nr:hypothetical protein LOC62_05G007559 [Vanrija pseudolonga]
MRQSTLERLRPACQRAPPPAYAPPSTANPAAARIAELEALVAALTRTLDESESARTAAEATSRALHARLGAVEGVTAGVVELADLEARAAVLDARLAVVKRRVRPRWWRRLWR